MAKKTKTSKQAEALKKVTVTRLHVRDFQYAADNKAPVDIYIRLPKNKRFVMWVEQGEDLPASKIDKIANHPDPYVYVVETSLHWGERPGKILFEEIPHVDQNAFEVIPDDLIEDLPSEKRDLLVEEMVADAKPKTQVTDADFSKKADATSPPSTGAETSHQAADLVNQVATRVKADREVRAFPVIDAKEVESRIWALFNPLLRKERPYYLSDLSRVGIEVTDFVSEELQKFRRMIAQNPKYAEVSEDSAAIYAVSVLFFLSNGYSLRGILEELGFAVLFMDLPMAELGGEISKSYYTDRDAMDVQQKKSFLEHPTLAHKAAREKLKKVSQNCLRMIEGHHEWANGEGYPRGIRSENLPPLVRILALAVLVFEEMRRAAVAGAKIDFFEGVRLATEMDKAQSSRRAHSTTVQGVLSFLEEKSHEATSKDGKDAA